MMYLDAKQFYASPFRCLAGSRQLIKYYVLDCEPCGERTGRYQLADIQVCSPAPCHSTPGLGLARLYCADVL
jgi:hypothetical protein